MMGIKAWFTNSIWQLSTLPAWLRNKRSATRVCESQQKLLNQYIHGNQDTDFGRRASFSSIKTVSDFQTQVPITTYDDYTGEMERIALGEPDVLSTSPVRIFELSSGSTAPSKMIPYTDQLHAEFQAGISPWIFDLYRNFPQLKSGVAYWSISPLTDWIKVSPAGIPIGFEEDSSYLGSIGKILEASIMAVPKQVKYLQNVDNFSYATLLFLLRNQNLRLVSIWNPTFLTLLLERLPDWWALLVDDIGSGAINLPEPAEQATCEGIQKRLRPDPERARTLSRLEPTDYIGIWPGLKLISCWMDGPSRPFADQLKTMFPGVIFQGKGLIATEAFCSFPIVHQGGAALAINCHFFEFLPLDDENSQVDLTGPLLAHELEEGNRYSIVVTTGGGLYRYNLGDVIEVVGTYFDVPLIRFIGKTGRISDWFGEKLNESFVSSVLEELFRKYNLQPLFFMLAPNDSGPHFRYTLYIQLSHEEPLFQKFVEFVRLLDSKLRQNFHYDYCRKLNQIAGPDLFVIEGQAQQAYLETKKDQGQKLGDIKHTTLETSAGWSTIFHGRMISLDASHR